MEIIFNLLQTFFTEEKINTGLMVSTSFLTNILQTNAISYITANIIGSLQKNNLQLATDFFKYFVIVSIVYLILYYFYKIFQNKLLTKMRQWIRFQLVKMLMMVNNENLSSTNFTRLTSPINRLSSVCFMVFNDMITYVLPTLTFLVIIAAYFIYKNVWFGLGFILGNLILIIYLAYNWNEMKDRNNEYESHVTENEFYLSEILGNMDKIIYRGQTDNEIGIFSGKKDASIKKAYEFYSSTNAHCSVMNAIVYCVMFSSIGYLIYLFSKKKIDLTIFITFFTIILLYRDKMFSGIQQVPDFIEFLGRSESVLSHFQDINGSYESAKKKKYDGVELEFKVIEFDNVTFKYDTAENYLFQNKDLVLNTHGNRIIGITGLSGNGKSSFAKLLLKLYSCGSGTIYVDGTDIKGVDPDYIRNNITYVNQNSKLFDKKIIENIMYGCSDQDVCKAHFDTIIQYPKIRELYRNVDVMETMSGSLGEKLSGGQRQVVNIIGGLINPSKILILDEPTNALDPELKAEVIELVGHFRKHKQCILIITHDEDVRVLFDDELVL